MKELTWRGHQPAEAYPSEAVDIEFGVDGIRPRPSPQQSFASPEGSLVGCHYDVESGKYILVTRSGATCKLWIRSGSTNTQKASWTEGVAQDFVCFVPINEKIAVVCRSRIFLVDLSDDSVVQVSKPSTPTNVTATAKQDYIVMDSSLSGASNRATATLSNGVWSVDDQTTDSARGAYQELYRSAGPVDAGHADCIGYKIESCTDDVAYLSVAAIAEERPSENEPRFSSTLQEHDQHAKGWYILPLQGQKLAGLFVNVDIGTTQLYERIYYFPASKPKNYRVVSVNNGFESDPLDVTVSFNATYCPVPGGYVVEFSNLPAGTWRIYREDSAGTYRLVAEGTGSSYTDRKREEELGEPYHEPDYPTVGLGAVLWQNRVVVVGDTNKLYVSDVGSFSWATDDSDVIEFPSRIRGLATIGARLYVNHSGAWWELLGGPGAWIQRRVLGGNAHKSVSNVYVSDCALAIDDRLYLPAPNGWQEVRLGDTPISCWSVRDAVFVLGSTNTYVLRYGRWARWTFASLSWWMVSGIWWFASAGGVGPLNGSRVSSAYLREELPVPSRVSEATLYADGSGSITATINGKSESKNLPALIDRKSCDDWELSVRIDLTTSVHLKRTMLSVNRSDSYAY